tara:strand:+ start:9133 stop:10140 length:1008 start_codon:yes stop_codon:yes gene_type:complete
MNILITGGAGFVGSQLGDYLMDQGHQVVLLDNLSYGHKDNLLQGKFVHEDIRNVEGLKAVMQEHSTEAVIHLAGVAPLPDCQANPLDAYSNNVLGTINVLETCRQLGIRKIIFASTSAVYENCKQLPFVEDKIEKQPNLMYSTTKMHCEMLCDNYVETYGMDIVCLRLFNVYGPHQDYRRKHPPLMGYITQCLLNNTTPVFFSDGNQRRDYIHVRDLAKCFERVLLVDGIAGEKFNVCTGETLSVKEIFAMFKKEFNSTTTALFEESEKFWDKYPSLFTKPFPLSKDRVKEEVNKISVGSYDKANKLLGWSPEISPEEGIKDCVDFVKFLEKNNL